MGAGVLMSIPPCFSPACSSADWLAHFVSPEGRPSAPAAFSCSTLGERPGACLVTTSPGGPKSPDAPKRRQESLAHPGGTARCEPCLL